MDPLLLLRIIRTEASLRVQEVQISITVEAEGHGHPDRVRGSLREQGYLLTSAPDPEPG